MQLTLSAGSPSQGWLRSLFILVFTSVNISRSCSRGRSEHRICCPTRSAAKPLWHRAASSSSGEPGHTIPAIRGCLFYPIHKNSAKVNAHLISTGVLKPVLSQLQGVFSVILSHASCKQQDLQMSLSPQSLTIPPPCLIPPGVNSGDLIERVVL